MSLEQHVYIGPDDLFIHDVPNTISVITRIGNGEEIIRLSQHAATHDLEAILDLVNRAYRYGIYVGSKITSA